MKKLLVLALIGGLLGLVALADPEGVKLPPAEEEIAALQEAWAQVAKVFGDFIAEIKDAVVTLNKNDQDILAKYRATAVQLKDLEAKLLQLQEICGRVPGLERRAEALAGRIEEGLAKIAELRKALDEAMAQGKANDEALSKSIADLSARLEAIQAELSSALSALGAKVEDLAKIVDQHEQRIATLESYDLGSLARRVLALEQAIQAVQIKIENNREKIAALEKTVGGLATDVSTLKESVLTLDTRVSDVENRLATLESTVGTNVQDVLSRLDTVQALAILGLVAGIGAIVLVLLGLGG